MKKSNLSLFSCTFLVAFAGCGGDTIYKIDSTSITPRTISEPLYQRLRASTVQIKTENAEGAGWGTGFFIDAEGHIVTNNHVAVGASELRIAIKGEDRLINAESIGYAECADLAVIKLTSSTKLPSATNNAKYLNWYDDYVTPSLVVGVAGFPEDVSDDRNEAVFTYNEGVVSTETRQRSTPWASTEAFDHSAFTTKGNSGGPLVEVATGKVVGVHYSGSIKSPNRKYAISGMEARSLVNRMINGENIYSIGISPEVYLDRSEKSWGVMVKSVAPGKHADSIGIRINDFIIGLGGGSLTEDAEGRVSTLEKYCSVLRTHNPNNPDDIEDRGDIVSIKIQRFTKNNEWVTCNGEINGDSLTLTDNSNVECPDSGKITFDENGYIKDSSQPPKPPSKKSYIAIMRHVPQGICESNYVRESAIEEGFLNPIFEEKTGYVYCRDYGKKDDDKECSIDYYDSNDDGVRDDHTDFTCIVKFDGFKNEKSSRSFNKFNSIKTIIDNTN